MSVLLDRNDYYEQFGYNKCLRKKLTIENPKIISQKEFDELVDVCILNDLRERLWRLSLTYSNLSYNFIKIFDFI